MALAQRAVGLGAAHIENQLTLAYVAHAAGQTDVADEALAHAVMTDPWITAAGEWSNVWLGTAGGGPVPPRAATWLAAHESESRFARPQVWIASALGEPVDAAVPTSHAGDGLDSLLRCDLPPPKARL